MPSAAEQTARAGGGQRTEALIGRHQIRHDLEQQAEIVRQGVVSEAERHLEVRAADARRR